MARMNEEEVASKFYGVAHPLPPFHDVWVLGTLMFGPMLDTWMKPSNPGKMPTLTLLPNLFIPSCWRRLSKSTEHGNAGLQAHLGFNLGNFNPGRRHCWALTGIYRPSKLIPTQFLGLGRFDCDSAPIRWRSGALISRLQDCEAGK